MESTQALFAAFPETRDLRDLARLLLFELGKLGKDLDDRTRGADRANHVLPDLWRFIEILETLEFGDRTCRALAEQRDDADAALRGAYGPAVRAQCASLDRQLGRILAHLHELAAIDATGNDDTDVDVGRPAFNHGEWERRFNGGRRSGVTVDRSAKFQHGAWLALSATRSRREAVPETPSGMALSSKTSNLSSSVESKSFRLMFGRIVFSRRVRFRQ